MAAARLLVRTRRGSSPGPVSSLTTDTDTGSNSSGRTGAVMGSTSAAGMSTMAVVPPYGEGLTVTFTPCRFASMPTTANPSRSVCEGSNSGGLARRSLMALRVPSSMPRPRSSTSTAKPLPTISPRTETSLPGEENVVAFSISSANRCMRSATAAPETPHSGIG